MMRDFIDGQEYDVRLCRSIVVSERTMPLLIALRDELKTPAPISDLPPPVSVPAAGR